MLSTRSIAYKLIIIFIFKALPIRAKGFFGGFGGDDSAKGNEHTFLTLDKAKAIGLSRDAGIYSHVVIVPWARPFKPGYCESWEWHTDRKYREQRLAICYELTEGSHNCDSPTGFCEHKCPYSNGSYPYWRLRNGDAVGEHWSVSSIQMFSTGESNKNLIDDPTRGYASSYFGPGYKPSNAFDNNPDTLWVTNGYSLPGKQWVAYSFEYPVTLRSIRIAAEVDNPSRSPTEIFVEGSCERYFRTFETVWTIENPKKRADIRAKGEPKRNIADADKPRFRRYR